MANLKCKSN